MFKKGKCVFFVDSYAIFPHYSHIIILMKCWWNIFGSLCLLLLGPLIYCPVIISCKFVYLHLCNSTNAKLRLLWDFKVSCDHFQYYQILEHNIHILHIKCMEVSGNLILIPTCFGEFETSFAGIWILSLVNISNSMFMMDFSVTSEYKNIVISLLREKCRYIGIKMK